tara:strand:- start:5722 stop:6864 length:1143 start_codon:yes stop_codon:yes gene_type:complete
MSTSALSINLRSYDKEIKEFLDNVLIGSPGGIQYRVHRQKSMNHRDKNLRFICLSKNLKLIGVVGLVNRIDMTGKQWLYIRYLHIKRTQHYPRLKKNAMLDGDAFTSCIRRIQRGSHRGHDQRKTMLQQVLLDYLDGYAQSLTASKLLPAYAFVEDRNHQSMRLCNRFGFEKIQEIQTLLFHRFNPSLHTQLCVITPEEIRGMRETLDQFYNAYDAYHTEGLSEQGYFLGYRVNGKWVAIARIMRHCWGVEGLPEYFSFLRKWQIDRWPYLRQLIPGRVFHFISADYIWFKQGCEKYLEQIMEHAIANEKVHTAMIWMSKKSPHTKLLRESISWGSLNKLGYSGSVSLVKKVFVNNYQESVKKNSRDKMDPVFINACDMT